MHSVFGSVLDTWQPSQWPLFEIVQLSCEMYLSFCVYLRFMSHLYISAAPIVPYFLGHIIT